ncbi:MAG: hypothetical protein AUF79_15305 [Crenarchaeota archaeon 13_1_20CM_2_51_8]|nr:MAG: hypothetical protein AUF79_15305 [Crenarchaeota archaeon 13_1_20CM_2_51_8]
MRAGSNALAMSKIFQVNMRKTFDYSLSASNRSRNLGYRYGDPSNIGRLEEVERLEGTPNPRRIGCLVCAKKNPELEYQKASNGKKGVTTI